MMLNENQSFLVSCRLYTISGSDHYKATSDLCQVYAVLWDLLFKQHTTY